MSFLTKRSSILIPCDPTLVYEILTDYDTYSEWMPSVTRSKLLAKEGDLAIAEFESVAPTKDLFVVEGIHTKNKMVLWRIIRGKIPISEIQWDIEPAEERQTRVALSFEAKTIWSQFLPNIIKPARYLKALQSHISAFLPDVLTDEDGEKILEIAETSEGLMCWIRGKKYILTPAPEGKS